MSKLYEEFSVFWEALDPETKWEYSKCSAFFGWKASRKLIKVKLPVIKTLTYAIPRDKEDTPPDLYEDDFYEVQGVEDALDAAGVKY